MKEYRPVQTISFIGNRLGTAFVAILIGLDAQQ
jgi:hypothetical protein